MGTEISLFDQPNQLPAYLGSFNSALGTDLALGGFSGNRIGLKGSRFRLLVNGQEEAILETFHLDVIIVGASPGVGRMFFGGNYVEGEKEHPLCYSSNGVEPGADIAAPQSIKCANCPQNEKGSKITADGTKTKACGYFKRLVVALVGDNEHRTFRLDAKSMSIFGDGDPAHNLFTLNEYSKKFSSRGLDPAHFVTRLSFDPQSSVPKLYFSPLRVITEDEAPWVMDLVYSDDTKMACTITAITDTSDGEAEAPAAAQPAPASPAPAQAQKPAPVAPTARPAATLQPKIVSTGKPAAPAAPAAVTAPTIVKTAPLAATRQAAPAAQQTLPVTQVQEVSGAEIDADLADFLKDLESTEGSA